MVIRLGLNTSALPDGMRRLYVKEGKIHFSERFDETGFAWSSSPEDYR